MEIKNTLDPANKPPVSMLVYGMGGVGKTTLVSTAPKPLLADGENGSKFFGLRGITLDVAQIKTWQDLRDFYTFVKDSDYETIAVDPLGKLMDMLISETKNGNVNQYKAGSGLSMAGWGYVKEKFREMIDLFLKTGKHVIFVAHVSEDDDDQRKVKRPQIATKMSEEIINMVDVVAWMTNVSDPETKEPKRVLLVSETDERYEAKDRTGQLGSVIEPDFAKIVKAIQGTESYAWSKNKGDIKPKAPKKVSEPTKEELLKGAQDSLKPIEQPYDGITDRDKPETVISENQTDMLNQLDENANKIDKK